MDICGISNAFRCSVIIKLVSLQDLIYKIDRQNKRMAQSWDENKTARTAGEKALGVALFGMRSQKSVYGFHELVFARFRT